MWDMPSSSRVHWTWCRGCPPPTDYGGTIGLPSLQQRTNGSAFLSIDRLDDHPSRSSILMALTFVLVVIGCAVTFRRSFSFFHSPHNGGVIIDASSSHTSRSFSSPPPRFIPPNSFSLASMHLSDTFNDPSESESSVVPYSFAERLGPQAALACDAGWVSVSNVCQPCPGGTYWIQDVTVTGGGTCVDCPIGTYSLAGAIQLSSCYLCPFGFYASTPRSAVCESCGDFTTTLVPGATSSENCFCAPGFRPTSIPIVGFIECQQCTQHEWCLPGNSISLWTVDQYCASRDVQENEVPAICTQQDIDSYRYTQGICYLSDQCSTYESAQLGQFNCIHPYRGVKCRQCLNGYGRSLLEGLKGGCKSCVGHYVYSAFVLFGMSLLSLWIVLIVKRCDALHVSRVVVILRVFIQHWQSINLLRYLNVDWAGFFTPWLNFITMGIPFAEIVECLFQSSTRSAPLRTVIAVLALLPLIVVLWSLILGFAAGHLRNCAMTRRLPSSRRRKLFSPGRLLGRSYERDSGQRTSRRSKASSPDEEALLSDQKPAPEKWKYFGLFTLLYLNTLPSFAMPLFWGVRCITVDATGKDHLFADLDMLCYGSPHNVIRFWSWSAIVIWIWLVPLTYMLVIWFLCDYLSASRYSEGWGYFFQGYRPNVQCWQGFVLLRLVLMMTVTGLSKPFQPSPISVAFASRSVYVYSPPPNSDSGSFDAVLGGFLLYLIGELIREVYSVSVSSIDFILTSLVRLSSLTVVVTWGAALITKADSKGTFGDPAVVKLEIEKSATGSSSDAADLGEELHTASWLQTFCFLSGFLNAMFIFWCIVGLIEAFKVPRWLGTSCPCCTHLEVWTRGVISQVKSFYRGLVHAVMKKSTETGESTTAQDDRPMKSALFLKRLVRSLDVREEIDVSQLRRSRELAIVGKQDISAVIGAIQLSADRPQAIAALLRLTLHPISTVREAGRCLKLLGREGFDGRQLEVSIRSFVDFRYLFLEKLCLFPNATLVDAWWTSQRLGVLRYPALDDPSLQLIAPYSHRESSTERGLNQSSFTSGLGQGPSSSAVLDVAQDRKGELHPVLDEDEASLPPSFVDWLWLAGGVLLRGRQSHIRRSLAAVVHVEQSEWYEGRITCGGVMDPFLQNLTQKVLECLILDLSETIYKLPEELPIDLFLASGVKPGTRNDGKTDATIRQYERVMNKGASFKEPRGHVLGRLLRHRQDQRQVMTEIRRSERQKATDALFQFGEALTPALQQQRNLEESIRKTSLFLSILPDARKCRHSITGEKDRTCDPVQLIVDFQDRTLVPTTVSPPEREVHETYEGYLQRILRFFERTALGDKRIEASSPLEQQKPTEQLEQLAVTSDLLFSMVCVGGEFSAEPPEVGIFVYGKLKVARGPDGTLIALDTTRLLSTEAENKEDLLRLLADDHRVGAVGLPEILASKCSFITLDPIVELAPLPVGNLIQGDADWTMDAWIFLPLFPFTVAPQFEGRSIVEEVTYHTLAASELMDSLLTIQLPSGRFGMLTESVPDEKCEPPERISRMLRSRRSSMNQGMTGTFVAFGPEGVLIEAVDVKQLESPCWHFISVTAVVRREDPSGPMSPITTVARLYIDGKFSGRLTRPGFVQDVETIGNAPNTRQAFGQFASLTIIPNCLGPKQIDSRYRERRIAVEHRLRRTTEAEVRPPQNNGIGIQLNHGTAHRRRLVIGPPVSVIVPSSSNDAYHPSHGDDLMRQQQEQLQLSEDNTLSEKKKRKKKTRRRP